ncbi:hypothetical protein IMY05_010G0130300 [Salix suchowensis]|nr:hypothetical protein IMY05_010G0130300 [Salix suchowensis]
MLCCPLHIFDTVIFAPSSPSPLFIFFHRRTNQSKQALHPLSLSNPRFPFKGVGFSLFFLGSFCYHH